jgi:hypothetical protein
MPLLSIRSTSRLAVLIRVGECIGDLLLVDQRRRLFALLIAYGELAIFMLQLRPRSALSNFCVEIDRFRSQLSCEIGKDAAE